MVAERVDDLLESFIAQHVSQNRSAAEITRMLRREVGSAWGTRSIHEITKRDVIDVVNAIEQRGAPIAANRALKASRPSFAGASADASLIATEGIASVGPLWAPISTLLGGLILSVGNRVSARLPPPWIATSAGLVMQLFSTSRYR